MKLTLESKIYAGYGVAVIIMLLIGVAVRKIPISLEESMRWADHTRMVLMRLDEANSAVLEMQVGFRGYLIKPETRFLDSYNLGATHIAESVRQLRQLTIDDREQRPRLARIDALVTEVESNMKMRIELRRTRSLEAALAPGANPRSVGDIRELIAQMRETEQGLLDERSLRVKAAVHSTIAAVAAAGLLTMALLAAGALLIHRDLKADRMRVAEIRDLNASLSVQNLRLEEANHELEAFSYSISHDLRAPLRHIDGFANLLKNHAAAGFDDKSRQYLDTISRAALRMGRLIDDLLHFSRMGRTHLAAKDVDSDVMVAEVIREIEVGKEGPPIEWSVTPLPRVQADLPMLKQVWSNLIGNAVKYSGRAPQPRIVISGAAVPASGECIFSVRDNGVGFDMKHAAQLFGVFHRLHSDEQFKGTGIGLAIVRRIIARHGGRTWAEARPGEGAAFYFSLPVKT